MRGLKFSVLGVLIFALCSCASFMPNNNAIKVMSYNIRCGFCEKPDDINHWSKRKILVADLIQKSGADIVGLQEAEEFQVIDLVAALPEYAWYGIGREEGQKGEMNAILVRKSRFAIENPRTIHLSQTPNQVSLGWDAKYRRTLTMAKLRDVKTNQTINFFNSHFDNEGRLARLNAANMIVEEARKLVDEPIVLTGDFNDSPGFDGYVALSGHLFDAAKISDKAPIGGDMSFNGFGRDLTPGKKIDYIFVSKAFKVKSHAILTRLYGGNYPSDHYPILSEISAQ